MKKIVSIVLSLLLVLSCVSALADAFAGSGTTAVVAKKLGRNYIGIEQNPTYCAWAEYRLEKAEEDKTIQGLKDGVFWDRNAKIK